MTAEKVLTIARGELGTKESPANSNTVKYNTWYYGREVAGKAYPWCMAFVQWVFAQAGGKLPYLTASCSGLLTWYQRNQPWKIFKSPAPGDIVIYNFGHTGIVEAVSGSNITAIEGNTSPGVSGSQSNGGMVCRRTRGIKTVTAFIRPLMEDGTEKEDKRMDNNPSPAHKEGVEWARKKGILVGDASGDLKLSEPVTRQQLCTMLYRFARTQEERKALPIRGNL